MRRFLTLWMVVGLITLVFLVPPAGAQKKPILIGYPAILSGGGALNGRPVMVGGQLAEKEINEKGGILGRPFKLLVRDCKETPDEATRVARELILKEKVEFLVGGFTASQGLALSEVAKTEKII